MGYIRGFGYVWSSCCWVLNASHFPGSQVAWCWKIQARQLTCHNWTRAKQERDRERCKGDFPKGCRQRLVRFTLAQFRLCYWRRFGPGLSPPGRGRESGGTKAAHLQGSPAGSSHQKILLNGGGKISFANSSVQIKSAWGHTMCCFSALIIGTKGRITPANENVTWHFFVSPALPLCRLEPACLNNWMNRLNMSTDFLETQWLW